MAHRRAERRSSRAPWGLLTLAIIGLAFLVIPLLAMVLAVPWPRATEIFARPEVQQSVLLSLLTATIAALVCAVVGVPLAWLLARLKFRGAGLVRALVAVPLVLPPVVGGVALASAWGRSGLLGAPLFSLSGYALPFTTPGVIAAQVFVALPFLVVTVTGALRGADPRLAEAAATLGASGWYTFRRVTLPAIAPSVAAGLVLAWARALGEFGATITFAGNLPGTTQTTPLAVFVMMQTDPDAAIALSLVLLVISVAVLALVGSRRLTGVTS